MPGHEQNTASCSCPPAGSDLWTPAGAAQRGSSFLADPPSLDAPETKLHCASPGTESAGLTFRHSGWAPDRTKIRAALAAVGTPESALARWDYCGDQAWVMADKAQPGRYKIHCDRCRSRWCRPCAAERAARVRKRLVEIASGRRLKLMTLTLRSLREPLPTLLDRLYACARQLRRLRVWTDNVRAAAQICEIKRSDRLPRWHVHLHLLVDASYIPQAALSTAWLACTGDSPIVDIRTVRNSEDAARYVAKYVTKPLPRAVLADPDLLQQCILGCKGRRLITTLGEWRGEPLNDPPDDATEWVPVAPLAKLQRDAEAGDEWSAAVLRSLQAGDFPCPDPRAADPPPHSD